MRAPSLPSLPSIGQKEKLPRLVFTVIECQSCHAKTKRAFVLGDYVTKDEGVCDACMGAKRTSVIYSEEVPKPR